MSAPGARAAALAAIRLLGGCSMTVRLPAPPIADNDDEELGLPQPEFHDLQVTPCAVRPLGNGDTLLLADAATLENALGVTDANAAESTLLSAALVQVNGSTLLLHSVETRTLAGRAYLYRLTLRAAQAEALR